jgi:hypothetical protein
MHNNSTEKQLVPYYFPLILAEIPLRCYVT